MTSRIERRVAPARLQQLAGGVALVIAALGAGFSAIASDLQMNAPARLAALASGNLPFQPQHLPRTLDALRLVQVTTPDGPGGPAREPAHEDVIIVSLDISAPEELDDEIAAMHKLEVVKRLAMSSLGLRIVSYRVHDQRPLADILERMRADGRIAGVQLNLAYRPDPALDAESKPIGAPLEQAPATAAIRKVRKPAEARAGSRTASATAPPVQDAIKREKTPPVRIAADVLAGGL